MVIYRRVSDKGSGRQLSFQPNEFYMLGGGGWQERVVRWEELRGFGGSNVWKDEPLRFLMQLKFNGHRFKLFI